MRRAYVDSCLFIYWVEQSGSLAEAATCWLKRQTDVRMCVSALVQLEVLVKPKRTGNMVLGQDYCHNLHVNNDVLYPQPMERGNDHNIGFNNSNSGIH